MYGNKQQNNNDAWQGKKKNDVDEEGPVSKKTLRNQWKKNKKQQQDEQQIQIVKQKINVKKNTSKSQKQDTMVEQLRKIIGNECDQKLIRKCIHDANFNMQTALNYIFSALQNQQQSIMDVFDKKQERGYQNSKKNSNGTKQSRQSKEQKSVSIKENRNKQKNKVEEQAYKLLNQMYEKQDIEISGFEFEQLFNEITQIIKEDQKQKGKGVIQINNFVETCMSAKEAILVGLKDVFQISDQIHFNQEDPIYTQLQQFIYDLTQKQTQQQVIRAEQFPTLGQNTKKNKKQNNNKKYSPPKRSIVNELQNQNKYNQGPISKKDFFVPGNNKPIIFQQKNSKGIFNVDNQQQSQDALRGLHKQYSHVSIQSLKIVYLFLEKNYNLCRTFLDQYYGKDKVQQKIYVESPLKKSKEQSGKKFYFSNFRKESVEQIDQQLQRWNLSQLRNEIQHLYGLRQVFMMTCRNIANSAQKKQLMRMAEQKAPLNLIRKLSKAARVKLIQDSRRNNPNYVDLHGHREEEIVPILQGLIATIKQQFDRGDERVKFKSFGGKTQAILQVMTGKGRHSQYGRSILKPYIKQWCQDHKLRPIVNQDNVQIYIPLL